MNKNNISIENYEKDENDENNISIENY